MFDAAGLMGEFIFQLMLRKWHTEAKTGVLLIKLAKRGASMKRALPHRSGTAAMHPRFSTLVLTTAALIVLRAAPAAAGPQGPTVVGGAATVQGQGGPAVVVNQSSSSAIINWNTFNIGANESVRFNQPGSSSVVVASRCP
jgi:hypothetical protein